VAAVPFITVCRSKHVCVLMLLWRGMQGTLHNNPVWWLPKLSGHGWSADRVLPCAKIVCEPLSFSVMSIRGSGETRHSSREPDSSRLLSVYCKLRHKRAAHHTSTLAHAVVMCLCRKLRHKRAAHHTSTLAHAVVMCLCQG
jgi:hypothetical protein